MPINDQDNPFDLHRDLLTHIMSLRNDSAPEGWYNHSFKDRPTGEQLEHFIDMLHIKCEHNKTLTKARIRHKTNQYLYDDDEAVFITLNMDKMKLNPQPGLADEPFGPYNHAKIKDCMMKCMDTFREANYKWCIEPVAVCEFYSKSGELNPHIHIICKKDLSSKSTISAIRQGLQRKYQHSYKGKPNKKNFGCYNVHSKILALTHGENYVHGFKEESKLQDVSKDIKYRSNFKYQDLYILYDAAKQD